MAQPLPKSIEKLWKDLQSVSDEMEKPEICDILFDNKFIIKKKEKNNYLLILILISMK